MHVYKVNYDGARTIVFFVLNPIYHYFMYVCAWLLVNMYTIFLTQRSQKRVSEFMELGL